MRSLENQIIKEIMCLSFRQGFLLGASRTLPLTSCGKIASHMLESWGDFRVQPLSEHGNQTIKLHHNLKSYKIKVKVIKILGKGECPLNLKVGDEFVFEHLPPPEFCHWAFHSLLPFITALRFGGNIPWEKKEGVCHLCCPDPDNPVVFEITRIEEK